MVGGQQLPATAASAATSLPPAGFAELLEIVASGRTLVLTGAGVSTDSGIPDYRGPGKPIRTPMTYSEFVGSVAARQRYWARAHLGWHRMSHARPNVAHVALARLERRGAVTGLITQNVDSLHLQAGSREVIELHGQLRDVTCLECGRVQSRDELAVRLDRLNPGFRRADEADHWRWDGERWRWDGDDRDAHHGASLRMAPDGDVELSDTEVAEFVLAGCQECDGVLKPQVVFFGESVPADRVQRAYDMVENAGSLLVVGTSLAVHSGRRFVTRAVERGVPVMVVNQGPTRADEVAVVRLNAGVSTVLGALADELDVE